MGAAGKYFKKQCQTTMFKLEHHTTTDFYISCWQKNRTVLPLLCIRAVVFLACLSILLASLVMTATSMGFGYWFIYLTHWGLVVITVASGFALAVSCRAYWVGPIEATFDLPCYVKAYWIAYNTAVPLAFFISIYYFSILTLVMDMPADYDLNPVLDIFIHLVNSLLMLILLFTSRHPARLLHFIHPLGFAVIYMIFSVLYYAFGGTDPLGNEYIYPTLNWANGWLTFALAMLTGVLLVVVHFIAVGLTAARNALTRRYRRDSQSMPVRTMM